MRYRWLLGIVCLVFHVIAGAGEVAPAYRLGAGDSIRIYVLNEPSLTMDVRVSHSGTISYPFLGEIRVQGLTTHQVEDVLIEGLKGPYLTDPKINVSVAEYRKFFIGGQVRSPGGYPYEPGLTVSKAIVLAGGLTELASSDITIIHEDDPSHTPEAVDPHAPVRPGDVINVEESFF